MGLDAVVYKNVRSLTGVYANANLEVDETNGEVSTRGADKVRPDMLVAARERLGNVHEVASLRHQVRELLGDGTQSLVMREILYSGSHSGDVIATGKLRQLSNEMEILGMHTGSDVQAFARRMSSLIRAAESEQNPIVFV